MALLAMLEEGLDRQPLAVEAEQRVVVAVEDRQGCGHRAGMLRERVGRGQPMVGMLKSAPARMPVGQREVTALSLV